MYFFRKLGLQLIKMRNTTLLTFTIVFVIFCTVVMFAIEPTTFGTIYTTFYFVMTTFATVGYGDFYPESSLGRAFAMFMYLFGIGLLGVVIGKIVDTFTLFRRKREEGKMNYTQEKHIVIVGWGKKTEFAIKEILDSDPKLEIVIIDTLQKAPFDLEESRVSYIQGDPTEEVTFDKANITKANAVIIFGDDTIQDPSLRDAKTLMVAITVERLASHIHTTVDFHMRKAYFKLFACESRRIYFSARNNLSFSR